ncbi:hypothetical protein C1893_23320 [Pseudomonas sp. MPR-ANC1]|nr:hypothetical protein C1893_23320 [Pseudomonas sp. MPR-ANC1]
MHQALHYQHAKALKQFRHLRLNISNRQQPVFNVQHGFFLVRRFVILDSGQRLTQRQGSGESDVALKGSNIVSLFTADLLMRGQQQHTVGLRLRLFGSLPAVPGALYPVHDVTPITTAFKYAFQKCITLAVAVVLHSKR